MDLQGHSGFQTALLQNLVDSDHGYFDQVCRRSLQRGVYCCALGEASLGEIFAVDVGDGADAAVKGFYFQVAAGFFESFVDESADAFVFFEIVGDE